MRRNDEFLHRVGGRHYRSQLDRIERMVRTVTIGGIIVAIVLICVVVYFLRRA